MGKSIRTKIVNGIGGVDDNNSEVSQSNKVDGFDIDYDVTRLDLLGEYESLKSSYDEEMRAYNSCYRAYSMLPIGNERIGMSQTITPIIYEKIEWISATINKIVTESNDAFEVTAMGDENIFSANASKELLTDAIGADANSHVSITDIVRTSFIAGNAYAKCNWEDPTKSNPIGHFSFEAVPNERLRWDHDYGSFYNSPCVYDTTNQSMSSIILAAESDGDWMLDKLNIALKSSGSSNGEDNNKTNSDRYNSSASSASSSVEKPGDSRKMYTMIEAYTEYDINGDGVAEKVIAVFVNNEMVRFVENNLPDEDHPYLCNQGKRDPHEALGWTMEKILGHNQHNATMIDRMIINNIAAQDNGIMMYDENNVTPLAASMHKIGMPRTMLPVGDISRAIAPVPTTPMQPHVAAYKDNLLSMSDGLSGFTKSTNLDVQMLKGTANNANIVNNSGQTRIWEDTKRFMEMFYKPLASKCVAYSGVFLTPKDFETRFGIKLSKKEISSLFSVSRYKIKVNVSLPSDNAEKLQQMMTWAQYFMPMAAPDANGQLSEDGQKISKAASKMAFYAAKLMNIPEFERDLNGGEFIGTNGLSVTEEDLDNFRASIDGFDQGDGMLDIASFEDGANQEMSDYGYGEPDQSSPEDGGEIGSGQENGQLEGLLGSGGNVEGGDGLLPEGVPLQN